jgi:D-beta-D-heptose 7-phosphate kinase/D-beta-D-heptose 1-phosphate adenosyltransferase
VGGAFVSVVGDDPAGTDLTGLIGGQPGVEPWLLVQGGRVTTVKTRMIAQGQQLLRVDREDTTPIHPKLAERMLRIARDAMAATSLTILSDYRKGVMSGDVPEKLVAAARQAGRTVLVDLRGGDFALYAGADVVLPSRRDLARATGIAADDDDSIAAAAARLRTAHGFGAVLVARAEDGMTLVHDAGVLHFRHNAVEAFDVSGANDTGVATLGAALAAGVALPVAARLANIAAGITMGRMGTAVVREQDLVAALSPEDGPARKIVARETMALQVEGWRRRGLRTGFTYGCFDALRPGHMHMLQQARAVCDRLVVAICGDGVAPKRRDGRPAQHETARAARLAALPVVDAVVIADADGPLPLLQLLRPDVLITGADRNGAEAALLGEWGGRVVLAERLPEPA